MDEQQNIMECFNCKVNVENVGGAQMKGCEHFLCANCIVNAVKQCQEENGIKCKCQEGNNGVITLEELSFMVPPDVYTEYLNRVTDQNSRKRGAGDAPNLFPQPGSSNSSNANGGAKRSKLDNANSSFTDNGWDNVSSVVSNLMKIWGMSYEEALNHVDSTPVLENPKPISCSICLDDAIPAGEGVILKDCYHQFCKNCLKGHIENTDTAEVKCPYIKDDYSCKEILNSREISQLVSKEEYDRHFDKLALKEAEESLSGLFHCLTPDCKGFCLTDTETGRVFLCPLCNASNCVICKVIHDGGCAEFWDELEAEEKRKVDDQNNRIQQRKNDELSSAYIERNLAGRVWMRCPRCNVVIEKNGGCSHMICKKCKHDFHWNAPHQHTPVYRPAIYPAPVPVYRPAIYPVPPPAPRRPAIYPVPPPAPRRPAPAQRPRAPRRAPQTPRRRAV